MRSTRDIQILYHNIQHAMYEDQAESCIDHVTLCANIKRRHDTLTRYILLRRRHQLCLVNRRRLIEDQLLQSCLIIINTIASTTVIIIIIIVSLMSQNNTPYKLSFSDGRETESGVRANPSYTSEFNIENIRLFNLYSLNDYFKMWQICVYGN